ncbi:MAG TPA: haloacid dehalogenase-like hydrolase [Dokdonella sp.]|nr:haloacid dehalogenase-like hydrolase [Dokdonella sp.]
MLFDFDGVLMRGDAYSRFVLARLLRSAWRLPVALAAMPLLLPLAVFRSLRPAVAETLVRISLLGVRTTRYRELARAFAGELVQRPRIFIRDGIGAMRRHVAAGDRVVIVTGCEETLVRAIFDAIGLHGIECIASQLQDGRLGMRKKVHNIGSQKPRQLAGHGIAEPWAIAYSDSSRDIPMLERAGEPVLVNADAGTRQRVERALGRPVARVDWF